ncbi:DUF2061 domain-containing protein [Aestuariispira insulae]|uniref:Putative membrane protein n=1 Tax=Aestuariispira insulae TaxID=1461337 RepID=A0A3D9HWY6_9PROT|nr:DUF2061 domain-containing protein [Aestuariispira insulae]RED54022.1 putative membrane protein [Aestuariispira insulae]
MRLLAKTVSYGVTHLAVATGVAYALTGDLMLALGIGIIEPMVQTGVFAIHDHFWERKPDTGRFRIGCHHAAA